MSPRLDSFVPARESRALIVGSLFTGDASSAAIDLWWLVDVSGEFAQTVVVRAGPGNKHASFFLG